MQNKTESIVHIPQHVAVIMDGNGRWAEAKGLPRSHGHHAGTKKARELVANCRELGVKHLTLYTFSKENWSRPKEEITILFNILVDFLKKELPLLLENDIRLHHLGEMTGLPLTARQALKYTLQKTNHCQSMVVNLALNYSGRDELTHAVRTIVAKKIPPQDITPETLARYLYTAGQPDPDLIIRTSGELRLSNYLLFQAAYAEFYFTDVLWPDFGKAELLTAFQAYSKRTRRYGKTDAQRVKAK